MQNIQNVKHAKCKICKTKICRTYKYTKEAKRTNCGSMQICNYMMNCLNMQNANIELCKTPKN